MKDYKIPEQGLQHVLYLKPIGIREMPFDLFYKNILYIFATNEFQCHCIFLIVYVPKIIQNVECFINDKQNTY